ncbi:MAG: DinB family protein [Chloroflexi bacterium]|nr:DinB family protein [Chloroflexota bacterium]
MAAATPAKAFLARLDAVTRRLVEHTRAGMPSGLTEPDSQTGERWDAGQVWAHLAEFLPYWMGEVRQIIEVRSSGPAPFGRVKSDPGRVAAIERGRRQPIEAHMTRMAAAIGELRAMLAQLPPEAWAARGKHPTLGWMDLPQIVERFMVGHLEEHADQLDSLRKSTPEARGRT